MIKYLFAVLLSAIVHTFSFGQKTDVGNWFIYFGNQKINDKWSFWNEVQYRNFNVVGDLAQLLVRTAIGYNLSENNNIVHLGYAFIHSEPYIAGTNDKRNINENRIYQQFLTRQQFGRVFLSHRSRFEQRFLPTILGCERAIFYRQIFRSTIQQWSKTRSICRLTTKCFWI